MLPPLSAAPEARLRHDRRWGVILAGGGGARLLPLTVALGRYTPQALEREADLRFEAPVVGRLVETFAVLPARHLIRKSEIGRRDVAGDRAGIGVIQQVADRQADADVVAP